MKFFGFCFWPFCKVSFVLSEGVSILGNTNINIMSELLQVKFFLWCRFFVKTKIMQKIRNY
jgi:hypothetical protein